MKRAFIAYLLVLVCGAVPQLSAHQLKDSLWLSYIRFEGNKRTRPSVMLRELSIRAGERISSKDLFILKTVNQNRLMNLPLFSEVIVFTDTLSDSSVGWRIEVKEQWYILPEVSIKLADRNFNVWWDEHHHNLRRINLGLTLKHRNFRGNLETLSATAQAGYTQKFGMEYFRPYIDKQQKNGLGASFFLSKNEETYFNTDLNKLQFVRRHENYIIRQFEAATLYVHRPAYATKHSFELRYRDFMIDDTIEKLNRAYFDTGSNRARLFEFTYRYEYNGVDNWNYPLVGTKIVGYAVGRAGIVGMDYQGYVQAEIGYFKRLIPKLYFAGVFRGRLTAPNKVPYYFRSALGINSEYVRGYEYYVIDGSQYTIGRADLKFEAVNLKIRHIPISFLSVIPVRIYPKVFVDAGYAANRYPGNSFLNNRALVGYGVGIDLVSSYEFKFRLEYSFNHLGEKGVFLHLNSE